MKFFFLFLLVSYALAAETLPQGRLQTLLPAPLNEFKINSTTISQIEGRLGKAHLVEGQDYYWEQNKLKYAIKITLDQNKTLTSIHYTFTKKRPSIKELGEIDSKKFTPSPTQKNYYQFNEKSGEVILEPLTKTIYSVKIW